MNWAEFFKILTITNILAFIGAISIILLFFEALFNVIPKFGKLRADFWGFLSRRWKYKNLEKKAIASEIENVVNETVADLQSELPRGWISRASIKWVDNDIKDEELSDREIILRIRPMDNQDLNLINGIYLFFTKALFPETKEIIPQVVRKAAALQIARRNISEKKPFLTDKFEKGILESAIKNDPTIVEFIERYEDVDSRGFFTGSFLREIHEIATRVQFKELRNKMDEEIKSVLEHTREFVANIHKEFAESGWYRKGPATSYKFLLVARPSHGGVNSYTKRVRESLESGIERIYVMGTSQEKRFFERVISAIAKLPECRLVEIFNLHRDYRGDRNGIGALFVSGNYDDKTEKEIEKFFKEENIKEEINN